MEASETLLHYRPKRLWVRLASFFTTNHLLSKQVIATKAARVQRGVDHFYFKTVFAESLPQKRGFTNIFLALIGLVVVVAELVTYASLVELVWWLLVLLVIIIILWLNVKMLRNPADEGSFSLSQESLHLTGTGEFMWSSIAEILFKERAGKLRVLFIQLSNGTIVEHRVKPYNNCTSSRTDLMHAQNLRELIFSYWLQANSLDFEPIEEREKSKQI